MCVYVYVYVYVCICVCPGDAPRKNIDVMKKVSDGLKTSADADAMDVSSHGGAATDEKKKKKKKDKKRSVNLIEVTHVLLVMLLWM